jgi:hypothetical protein
VGCVGPPDVVEIGCVDVSAATLETTRLLYSGWTFASSLATKCVPSETP